MQSLKINLSSIDSETKKVITFFINSLDSKNLILFQEKSEEEVLSFEKQLLIRYQNKYPIYKLEKIKNQLYYLAWSRKIERKNTSIYVAKNEIFETLDKFFSNKKPNKFLDWFENHPVFSTAVVGAVISAIIGTVVAKLMS